LPHSVPRYHILFQRYPIGRSNYALGRQDTGRWTPGDSSRPDKFGNRVAIFVRHVYPLPINSLDVRSARGLSRSTTAVSSASLSWVSRFLPQGNLSGLLGAVCEAVHLLVNFLACRASSAAEMSGSIVLYMIGLLIDVGYCQRCSGVRSLRASGSRLIACSAGPVLQPSAISDSHDDQDLVRARGTATETVIVSKCANDQESSLWPSGTSRLVPAAATFTFEEITALPPPIAARIGLPSRNFLLFVKPSY